MCERERMARYVEERLGERERIMKSVRTLVLEQDHVLEFQSPFDKKLVVLAST